MRIALSAIVVLLGVNLLVSLLNSDMMKTIESRNEKLCQLDQSLCRD
jgi:hypothetical protein